MLNLTKPVRIKESCNIFLENINIVAAHKSHEKNCVIIEYMRQSSDFYECATVRKKELENIPEPKVATALVSVYKSETGDIYLSCACPDNGGPMVKITYTEGAENPWQIKEV